MHALSGSPSPFTLNKAIRSVALFLAAFIVLFLCMNRVVNPYDEGLVLTGAMLVKAGKVIHRDFYANYGPGEFYLLSWLFDAFGERIVVERVLDLSIRAGIVVLVYAMAARYAGRRAAVLGATLCLSWLATIGSYGYPVYPALLCAMAGTWLVVPIIHSGLQRQTSLLAGLMTAAVAFFRYDIGIATFGVHILFLAVSLFPRYRRAPSGARAIIRGNVLLYASGFVLPLAGLMLAYASHGVFRDFVHDIVSFPSKHYVATRRLPFPGLRDEDWSIGLAQLAIYLPPMIIAGLLCSMLVASRRPGGAMSGLESEPAEAIRVVQAFLMLAAVFYVKGMVRVGIDHMQLSLIPAVFALVVYAGTRMRRTADGWLPLGLLALTCMAAMGNASVLIGDPQRVWSDPVWLMDYPAGRDGVVIEKTPADRLSGKLRFPLLRVAPERDAALDYLVRHSAPNEPVFVGLAHNDRIFVNDVSAYFLSQRMPATKWHHFDPALQNSRPIQEAMVAELERTRAPWVWADGSWDDVREPNESAVSSGVTLLDDYIRSHYDRVKTFGKIRLLHRRD